MYFSYVKFCFDHLPFVVDVSGSLTLPPPHSWPCAAFPGQRLDECFFSPSPNIPRHVHCTSALSLNPPPVALGPNHMVQLVECCKKGLAVVIIWWIFLRKEVFYDDIITNRLNNNLHCCVHLAFFVCPASRRHTSDSAQDSVWTTSNSLLRKITFFPIFCVKTIWPQ